LEKRRRKSFAGLDRAASEYDRGRKSNHSPRHLAWLDSKLFGRFGHGGRFRLGPFAAATLARTGRRNGQIHLVLPLTGPQLTRPALEGDRPDRRTVFIPDHLAPGAGISRANLRGAFPDAQQTFTRGSQARHGSPILGTRRSTAHLRVFPDREPLASNSRFPEPGIDFIVSSRDFEIHASSDGNRLHAELMHRQAFKTANDRDDSPGPRLDSFSFDRGRPPITDACRFSRTSQVQKRHQ